MISRSLFRAGLVVSCLLAAAAGLVAQPSGGPYGPLRQTYEVPAGAAHVYYVAPDGSADAAGTSLEQPTTLAAAIAKVVTGDAIILRGGTYRTGGLQLNQGITLQPYRDEQPVLKGTQIADQWEAQRNGLWRASWSTLFPQKPAEWWRRSREGRRTPLWLFNNDMVFVDGRMLKAVGWEGAVDENSYHIDYDAKQIYLGFDPTGHVIEVTAFDSALVRTTAEVHGKTSDRQGPVIRGLTFTQYAYRALEVEGREPEQLADPATFGNDVVGTTLEHVTITFCSRVAGYFRGNHMVFRHCLISDTSTEGIYVISSADVLLEKNIFRRNNIEQITGYYPSAVKIFNQSYRVVCRDNLVTDNRDSNGIWYDVGNVDGVFVNNWIEDTLDGFFYEISRDVICAGNVFVNCDKGVRSLNAAGVRVYNNTFVNALPSFERTERSAVGDHFGWHPATGPDVDQRDRHVFVGNLVARDDRDARALLQFEQAKVLGGKLTKPQIASADLHHNLYIRSSDLGQRPLLTWAPAATATFSTDLKDLAAVQQLSPNLETGSRYETVNLGSVFRSPDLRHYEINPSFSAAQAQGAPPLPADVLKALGWTRAAQAGAYPGKK